MTVTRPPPIAALVFCSSQPPQRDPPRSGHMLPSTPSSSASGPLSPPLEGPVEGARHVGLQLEEIRGSGGGGEGEGGIFSSGNVLSVWLQLWSCTVDGWGWRLAVMLSDEICNAASLVTPCYPPPPPHWNMLFHVHLYPKCLIFRLKDWVTLYSN